ncbi:hypothetical protein J6590_063477 [Homalodisca vitripennis]|nr:hypothetical protein J6590_063477 [Homalodisca vitripennis]
MAIAIADPVAEPLAISGPQDPISDMCESRLPWRVSKSTLNDKLDAPRAVTQESKEC